MNNFRKYFLAVILTSICGCGDVEVEIPIQIVNYDLDGGTDTISILDAGTDSSEENKSICQKACEYSLSCGIDLCKQYNDCMNISSQLECSLGCVLMASCSEINQLNMKNYDTKLGACSNECWK